MQNYFGPFILANLKPYNLKDCSNFILFFGLQLIIAPLNFVVLFGSRNSRNKGHTNIKGFTVSGSWMNILTAILMVTASICSAFD